MELFDGITKLVGGVVRFLHSKWDFPTGVSQLLEVKPHPWHQFAFENSIVQRSLWKKLWMNSISHSYSSKSITENSIKANFHIAWSLFYFFLSFFMYNLFENDIEPVNLRLCCQTFSNWKQFSKFFKRRSSQAYLSSSKQSKSSFWANYHQSLG